jgi:hypothetical protein
MGSRWRHGSPQRSAIATRQVAATANEGANEMSSKVQSTQAESGRWSPSLKTSPARLSALLGALVMVVAITAPASALVETYRAGSAWDMRAFVTPTHGSQFACGRGTISVRPLTVANPSNVLATTVYATVYVYRWNGNHFVKDHQIPNSSPNPGGVRLGAGRSFTVPAATFSVTPGHYYFYEEIDFWRGDNRLGQVEEKPNSRNDFVLSGGADYGAVPLSHCSVP